MDVLIFGIVHIVSQVFLFSQRIHCYLKHG